MSNNNKGEYLLYTGYTEYYIISGAYHFINVVNEILTYSASYSDNIKGYLHNKVLTKKATLNELSHNNRQSINNSNNDVDEDGFVVIKMRRPKKNNQINTVDAGAFDPAIQQNADVVCHNGSMASTLSTHPKHNESLHLENKEINDINDIVNQIIEKIVKDVLEKLL
jgi:hypothetical protein